MTRINTTFEPLFNLDSFLKLNRSIKNNFESLSSGLRINRASDDAAGLSVANRLFTQFEGLNEAFNATQTGINLSSVADRSLTSIETNLQRIRELSNQAANTGVYDSKSRHTLQQEINQKIDEINRIANTTQFSSNSLLNGNYSLSAGVRPGTSDYGIDIDSSTLTTQENFFTIRQIQEGSAVITSGNDAGVPTINAGIQNQQDIAVTQGTFNIGGGLAAAGNNLTALTFNGVSLQAGGTITFQGVLADGTTSFSGSFQLSVATDLAGGNGASTSFADAIQAAIDQAETEAGIDTATGTNAGETNVAFNTTTGRLEFRNGAETGVSDFDIGFTIINASGRTQNTTGITRAAEVGGAATGAQVGNAVTAITGNTFDTGQVTVEISDVTQAQTRSVESGIAFQQSGGAAATGETNLIGSVYNGVTLAQGDTITINGANADGSTFSNTITVSSVDSTAGNGAAVTLQDLIDELNVRDRSKAAGGIRGQSGFEDATAKLTSDGRIQLVDDVADSSQSNFSLTVNDRSSGGGTFGTIVDQGNVVQAGNAQEATVRVNGGPSQRVTAGQQVTLYGRSANSNGDPAQISLRLGSNLSNGTDQINVTREEYAGSLNGGREIRFGAGEQNVRFTSGVRTGESVTLDFDRNIDVPGQGEGAFGTVVISATGRQANFQIGANVGNSLGLSFGDARSQSLGFGEGRSLNDIDVTTREGANEALSIVDRAMEQIGGIRSQIGAFSNRLESTANELSVTAENVLASQSRIADVDMARAATQNAIDLILLQNQINVQIQSNQIFSNLFANLLR